MRIAIVILICGLMLGCAGFSRMMEYGSRLSDARVRIGDAGYKVWVHPDDDAILIQEFFGNAFAGAFAEGFTFGAVETSPPLPIPRTAAAIYLAQFGCSVTDIYTLEDITSEARFACDGDQRPGRVEGILCSSVDPYSEAWRDGASIPLIDCAELNEEEDYDPTT